MSTNKKPHVLIVGAGFGGLAAARSLAKRKDVRVTLVDKENHHLFQPLLYQVASAGLAPASIAVPVRSAFDFNTHDVRVVMDELTNLDKSRQIATFNKIGELHYDYGVLALGAETSFFGNQDFERYTRGLKSLDDALELRNQILSVYEQAELIDDPEEKKKLLTFVVVGGGPTGVEMAGALSELGRQVLARDYRSVSPEDVRVVLVERGDRLLASMGAASGDHAARGLKELGVEVRLSSSVVNVAEKALTLQDEIDGAKETIPCTVKCWAAGVRGASLFEALALPLERTRIRVNGSCRVRGEDRLFAIGDGAYHVPQGAQEALPGVAQVAIQQGDYVARVIVSDINHRKRPAEFVYRDKGQMATIGRSRAVAETGNLKLSGLLAWLAWGLVHVAFLISFRNRFIVMFNWVWSYVTFRRGARLIMKNRSK